MNPEREEFEFRTPAKSFDTAAPSEHSSPSSEGESDSRKGWIMDGIPAIWEVPSEVHEATAEIFAGLAERYNCSVSGNDSRNWLLTPIGSKTIQIRRGFSKEPDKGYHRPKRCTPNLIVEIANTQTMTRLYDVCQFWFELPNVLLFVGIKLYEPVQYQVDGVLENRRAIVALLFAREDVEVPARVISFGDREPSDTEHNDIEWIAHGTPIEGVGFPAGVPCNAYGIPMYQLPLPGDLLLALDEDGDRVVRSPLREQYPDWTIDLFDLLIAVRIADNE